MPPLPTLLLLTFLVVPSLSTTLMFFRGNIICNLNRPFNYQIQVIEDDQTTEPDKISRSSFVSSPSSPSPYNITAIDTHDGFQNYFYIRFHIYHDCTDNGVHMKADINFQLVYIYPGSYYFDNHNLDITNEGDQNNWKK